MPRLKGSADLLEDRRKRALVLLDSGYSLNEVGRRIGCNASSVMRWRDARPTSAFSGLDTAILISLIPLPLPETTATFSTIVLDQQWDRVNARILRWPAAPVYLPLCAVTPVRTAGRYQESYWRGSAASAPAHPSRPPRPVSARSRMRYASSASSPTQCPVLAPQV